MLRVQYSQTPVRYPGKGSRPTPPWMGLLYTTTTTNRVLCCDISSMFSSSASRVSVYSVTSAAANRRREALPRAPDMALNSNPSHPALNVRAAWARQDLTRNSMQIKLTSCNDYVRFTVPGLAMYDYCSLQVSLV